MTVELHSSTSSVTSQDVEAQSAQYGENSKVPHFWLVLHPDGVTDAVLNYRYPGEGTTENPYVVDFLPQDASNPMTYPNWKKWLITALQAWATLAVAFVSTAYSGGIHEILVYFKVDTEVGILGISLFVLGFAIGPLLWAPLSGMMFSTRVFVLLGSGDEKD